MVSFSPAPPTASQADFKRYASAEPKRNTAGLSSNQVGKSILCPPRGCPPTSILYLFDDTLMSFISSVSEPHSHWCFRLNSREHSVPPRTTSTDNSLSFLCKDKEVLIHSHPPTHPPTYICQSSLILSTFTTRQLFSPNLTWIPNRRGALKEPPCHVDRAGGGLSRDVETTCLDAPVVGSRSTCANRSANLSLRIRHVLTYYPA